MEIVTIVLEGEMTHQDSMGNKAVIKAGDVQRMSAGTRRDRRRPASAYIRLWKNFLYPAHVNWFGNMQSVDTRHRVIT